MQSIIKQSNKLFISNTTITTNNIILTNRYFFSKLFGKKETTIESGKKKPISLGDALKGNKIDKLKQAFAWSSLKGNDEIKTAVYSIGVNNNGQLGLGDWKSETELTFNELFQDYSVRSLQSTLLHSAAITNTNDLLTWGANFNFQIGHKYGSNTSIFPNFIESTPYSVKVSNFPKSDVINCSIGGWSSFSIIQDPNSKQQSIYSWGNNQHGQLGIGTLLNIQTPNKVLLKDDQTNNSIIKIVNGLYHTLFLMDNGKLLSCGKSNDGQLGINNSNNNNNQTPDIKIPIPSSLLNKHNLIDIAAGYFHSIGLNDKNEIYQWGKGKLRYQDSDDLQLSPYCQRNDYVNNSIGNDNSQFELIKINGIPENEKIIQIGAADNLSMALTSDGNLYKWNSTDDNGVATKFKFDQFNNDIIKKFAISNTHGAVIFESTPNELCIWSLKDNFTLENQYSKSMFTTIFSNSSHPVNIKRYTLPFDHNIIDISMGTHYLILLAIKK